MPAIDSPYCRSCRDKGWLVAYGLRAAADEESADVRSSGSLVHSSSFSRASGDGETPGVRLGREKRQCREQCLVTSESVEREKQRRRTERAKECKLRCRHGDDETALQKAKRQNQRCAATAAADGASPTAFNVIDAEAGFIESALTYQVGH